MPLKKSSGKPSTRTRTTRAEGGPAGDFDSGASPAPAADRCWWAGADQASAAAKGLVGAMLIYNAGVPLLVLFGSLGPLGPLQWAAVLLHTALGIWCVRILADRVSP